MNKPELFSDSNRATYCPESNKIHLYVGRVPRPEYDALRAEGWVSTPKQSEAGGGEFAATWTPARRDTALSYAGTIDDEDMGPQERAADRAERFGGYRDKRTDEATGHADSFESGPMVHGYQNQARAERAAARHGRVADRAGDCWSKAEYWQRRTAGVIGHALYKSTPGVRMGRIKELEAAIRKHEADALKYAANWEQWKKIAAIQDPAEQTARALHYTGHYSGLDWASYVHPRTGEEANSLYCWLSRNENETNTPERQPITGAEAVALFFEHYNEPKADNAWSLHYKLRLAYENQMLEAQGGRLEQSEVLPGGKFCGKLILKVSKSSVTGRATSVSVLGPRVDGWAYKTSNFPGTEWAEHKFDLERYSPDAYTAPTPESLTELEQVRAAIKAASKAVSGPTIALINPTDADAERLQALWNGHIKAGQEARRAKDKYAYIPDDAPSEVLRMTQAQYSEYSRGTYGRAETTEICANGKEYRAFNGCYEAERKAALAAQGPVIFKIRTTSGKNYMADRVIILTDKPQKPLPAAVWKAEPGPAASVDPVAKFWAESCSQSVINSQAEVRVL